MVAAPPTFNLHGLRICEAVRLPVVKEIPANQSSANKRLECECLWAWHKRLSCERLLSDGSVAAVQRRCGCCREFGSTHARGWLEHD